MSTSAGPPRALRPPCFNGSTPWPDSKWRQRAGEGEVAREQGGAVELGDALAGGGAEGGGFRGLGEEALEDRGERGGVPGGYEQCLAVGPRHLRDAVHAGAGDGQAKGHGLEHDAREGLLVA